MKARAQAVRAPVAVLSPRSPVPVIIKFTEASLEKILETLGKLAGVNILFDESYRDKKYDGEPDRGHLPGGPGPDHLREPALLQGPRPEHPDHRPRGAARSGVTYDDAVLRTFYLQNADANETLNLVKTLTGIQKAAGNPSLGAITVVGTLDKMAPGRADHRGQRQVAGRGDDRGADPGREPDRSSSSTA